MAQWPVALFRKLRDRNKPKTVSGHVTATLGGLSASIKGQVVFPTLSTDQAEAIGQLDEWVRRIWDRHNDLLASYNNEVAERKKADNKLQQELSALLESRSELERQRTIQGMRWELVGLSLVAVGTLLQGLALF
jgi:hypothetical protein